MSEVNIAQLENHKARLETLVRRGKIAESLAQNPQFKELILDGFMVKDCAEYAQLSADPALSAANQADSLNIAQAAGHFKRWLSVVVRQGHKAEDDIKQTNDQIDDIRANGV